MPIFCLTTKLVSELLIEADSKEEALDKFINSAIRLENYVDKTEMISCVLNRHQDIQADLE